ncbi:MAG: TonB family protein, partial [Pseudomonadota bacterium]
ISISLMPTDEPVSDDSVTVGEELMDPPSEVPAEPESEAPSEPVTEQAPDPEPIEPEPKPEPIEPAPEPEPMPEPEIEEADPEPAPEIVPEPEVLEEPAPVEAPTSEAPSDATVNEVPDTESSTAQSEQAPTSDAPSHPGSAAKTGPEAESNDEAASSDIASAELGNAAEDNYNGALMRHMRQARKFDTNARRSSKISITIDAHGNVLEVRVLRASGDKTWDRRVIKELKRIAPYPAPPSGGTHSWSFDAVPK